MNITEIIRIAGYYPGRSGAAAGPFRLLQPQRFYPVPRCHSRKPGCHVRVYRGGGLTRPVGYHETGFPGDVAAEELHRFVSVCFPGQRGGVSRRAFRGGGFTTHCHDWGTCIPRFYSCAFSTQHSIIPSFTPRGQANVTVAAKNRNAPNPGLTDGKCADLCKPLLEGQLKRIALHRHLFSRMVHSK